MEVNVTIVHELSPALEQLLKHLLLKPTISASEETPPLATGQAMPASHPAMPNTAGESLSEPPKKSAKTKPAKKPEPEPEPEPEPKAKQPGLKVVVTGPSLDDVALAVSQNMKRVGGPQVVREVCKKFKIARLLDLPLDQTAKFMAALQAAEAEVVTS